MRAKLTAKGYKLQLADVNRPTGNNNPAEWDKQADKALSIIQLYLYMDVAGQFVTKITPQTLLAAIVAQYHPDANQEVERLEKELNKLTYDGTDPVVQTAKIRSLVAKLTLKQAAPREKTVRNLTFLC